MTAILYFFAFVAAFLLISVGLESAANAAVRLWMQKEFKLLPKTAPWETIEKRLQKLRIRSALLLLGELISLPIFLYVGFLEMKRYASITPVLIICAAISAVSYIGPGQLYWKAYLSYRDRLREDGSRAGNLLLLPPPSMPEAEPIQIKGRPRPKYLRVVN